MIQDLLKINPQNANSKFDGIQHVLQYEGHRGPADVQFVLKYGQVPSRYTQSNFDPDLILKSIQSGILKTLTLIHHASSVESEFQIDQIVLENTDVSCYLYLSHTPANGGTYELRASFLVEKSKEFYAFLDQELKPLLKVGTSTTGGQLKILTKDPYNGFDCQRANIDYKNVDLESMYNGEVKLFAEKVLPALESASAGLFILHGPPGTGKTSFINYLIQNVKRDFIYIPSSLVDSLALPDFIELLWQHRNSILVIEDAEKAIQTRNQNDYSPVSSLLNITDGLLGDVLHLKVICTVNNELKSIDEALLRKGRLKGKCYFGKLTGENATALSTKLGKNNIFKTDTTLAEVFKDDEIEFGQKEVNAIGFK